MAVSDFLSKSFKLRSIQVNFKETEKDDSHTRIDTAPAIIKNDSSFFHKCASLYKTGQYKKKNIFLRSFILIFFNRIVDNRITSFILSKMSIIFSLFQNAMISIASLMILMIIVTYTLKDYSGEAYTLILLLSAVFLLLVFVFLFCTIPSLMVLLSVSYIQEKCNYFIDLYNVHDKENNSYVLNTVSSDEFNEEAKKVLGINM